MPYNTDKDDDNGNGYNSSHNSSSHNGSSYNGYSSSHNGTGHNSAPVDKHLAGFGLPVFATEQGARDAARDIPDADGTHAHSVSPFTDDLLFMPGESHSDVADGMHQGEAFEMEFEGFDQELEGIDAVESETDGGLFGGGLFR